MRALVWDRDAVVTSIRDRIWLHLSPASTGHRVMLDAAELLRLPGDDVDRLADVHLLLHPAVGALLDSAPALLRRLPDDTTRTTEIGHDRARGPVDWPATTRRRTLDRTPVVVTHPNMRNSDVPAKQLLALLLRQVRDRAAALGLSQTHDGTTGAIVSERGRRAAALAAHRGLLGVTPAAPTPRQVQSLSVARVARRHAALIAAWNAYDTLVNRADPDAIRRVVEQQGIAAAADGALFEVFVLFQLRDALSRQGWTLSPARVFKGRVRFHGRRGADLVIGTFQGTPRPLSEVSRYVAAQQAHGMRHPHDLRPDLVLRYEPAGRRPSWLLVEAKTSTTGRGPGVLFRRAVADLLAYRWAYDDLIREQGAWGLGVVWGRGLTAADHDVRVCTPDRLDDAMRALLE